MIGYVNKVRMNGDTTGKICSSGLVVNYDGGGQIKIELHPEQMRIVFGILGLTRTGVHGEKIQGYSLEELEEIVTMQSNPLHLSRKQWKL